MGNQVVKEDDLVFILDPKTKKPVILGKGASGVVKLATFNDKKVAVKYYRDFEHDEEMAKEAKQEKDLLGALKHPNIVEFMGFNFEAGFILLEYVDNGDLFSALQKPETRLEAHGWQLILGIAEGLAFLHSKNILHLDLKSLNILLTSKWKPKITDVGLARKIQREKHESSPQHHTIAAKFTTQWAPPENFQQPYAFSFKSDVYSLAIIIWEIVTGELPWDNLPSWSVPGKVLDGERPAIPFTCSPELAAIMQAAWDNKPSARPSAKEIVTALRLIDPTNSHSHSHSYSHGHSHSHSNRDREHLQGLREHLPGGHKHGQEHGHKHGHGKGRGIQANPHPQTSHSEGFNAPALRGIGLGPSHSPSPSLSSLVDNSPRSPLPRWVSLDSVPSSPSPSPSHSPPPYIPPLRHSNSDHDSSASSSSSSSTPSSSTALSPRSLTGLDLRGHGHGRGHGHPPSPSSSTSVLLPGPGNHAHGQAVHHSLSTFTFTVCKRCNSNYDPAKNKKGSCIHTGKWHDSVSDCNIKCGLQLGVKRELGTCHWSCCYTFDHQGVTCPNSAHKARE